MATIDFGSAIDLIKDADTVAICGHVNPDGDCIGSVLALTCALRAMGKKVTPLWARPAEKHEFDFLAGYADLVPAAEYDENPDLFIQVDTSDKYRAGEAPDVYERSQHVLSLDHHNGDKSFAQVSIEDTSAPSVGVLVWELLQAMGAPVDADCANCCLVSLMTDTGRFQFQNTDVRAFVTAAQLVEAGASPSLVCNNVYQRRRMPGLKMEALAVERVEFYCDNRVALSWIEEADYERLGASDSDADNLIDVIRKIDGIEVAVLLRDRGEGIRGSMRSKTDFDVAQIAAQMNGGGHKAAAGFSPNGNLQQAKATVIKLLTEAFAQQQGETL